MKEMVGGCCVCSDERGWPDNPLVYCDGNGCTVAVHQACYGIVTVPTGPWYCRKCESDENKGKVRCELCPSRSGALKKTDTGGWAHVVCALYIPEVRFGNVTSMEPIVLRLIPAERYNKICYICHDLGKAHRSTAGACMQCNKSGSGCKQQFHVTCAQSLGLLCEEAGNYLDNVKYCGYCQHHYSKLFTNHEVTVIAKKKGGNVKTIPPYKPVPHDSQSSDSSAEKESDGETSGAGAPGGSTPTQAAKSKGPGRKSSHASTSGRSTAASAKQQAAAQPPDKKKSPARRRSSAGEGGSSKNSTPAPSPQHASETPLPAKASPSSASPAAKMPSEASAPVKTSEPVGVISSVASATASALASAPATPTTSTSVATSVVQVNKASFQESVITNTDAVDTKQTKKRKAVAAAHAAAAAAAAAATAAAEYAGKIPMPANNEPGAPVAQSWDQREDVQEPVEKIIRRSQPEHDPPPVHYTNMAAPMPPPPPPPPPAHSPSTPSRITHAGAMNPPPSTIRSPSPYTMALESQHGHPQRSAWTGLNVQYEQQHIPQETKSGANSKLGQNKEANESGMAPLGAPMPPLPPPTIRSKKRAAMAAAAAMPSQPLGPPPVPMQMSPTSTQSLSSVRRQAQQPPPPPQQPPIYVETVSDSPPLSPGERVSTRIEYQSAHTAPQMLGNELNPESGVAARLQEQLTAELAAHAAGSVGPDPFMLPPLINKAGGGRTSSAQSLDQLLERQWEQGSQFLMEQAQHFDIASLLSCLHQLRTENVRLEDHVSNLLQRRDHLLAVNARLAIPLSAAPVAPPPPGSLPQQEPRSSRENGGLMRPPPPPPRTETVTSAHHSITDPRLHQRHHRGDERMEDRSGLRMQDSVLNLGTHSQRPVNMEAQMMMREVQQKPS